MSTLREFEEGLLEIYDREAEALAEELLDLSYGMLSTYYEVIDSQEPNDRYRRYVLKNLAWDACELFRLLCLAYRHHSRRGMAYGLRALAEHYINVRLLTKPPEPLTEGPDAVDRYRGYMIHRTAQGALRELDSRDPAVETARRMKRQSERTLHQLKRRNKQAWKVPIGDWTGLGWNQPRRAKEAGLSDVYDSVYRTMSREVHLDPVTASVPRASTGDIPDYQRHVPRLTAQLLLGLEILRDIWRDLCEFVGFSSILSDAMTRVVTKAYHHALRPGVIPDELREHLARQLRPPSIRSTS